MGAVDMLKPTEAAVVASVALRDINRAIDERIVPEKFLSLDDGRLVSIDACPLISFYFDSAKRLTAEERLFTIQAFLARIDRTRIHAVDAMKEEYWTVRDEFLTINLFSFARRTRERMNELVAARNMVVSDPEILGGTPVIRGTRVPVHDVAASVSAGLPTDRILAAYPSIDGRTLELAVTYANANPARGRPRSGWERVEGVKLVANHKRPRPRKAG